MRTIARFDQLHLLLDTLDIDVGFDVHDLKRNLFSGSAEEALEDLTEATAV